MGTSGGASILKSGLPPEWDGFAFRGHALSDPADSIAGAAYFLVDGGQICL
jgi:hypothetical protein